MFIKFKWITTIFHLDTMLLYLCNHFKNWHCFIKHLLLFFLFVFLLQICHKLFARTRPILRNIKSLFNMLTLKTCTNSGNESIQYSVLSGLHHAHQPNDWLFIRQIVTNCKSCCSSLFIAIDDKHHILSQWRGIDYVFK